MNIADLSVIAAALVVVSTVSWNLGRASGVRATALDQPRPALRPNKEWNKRRA